jgi:putative hydrolase of the HAD superfamily
LRNHAKEQTVPIKAVTFDLWQTLILETEPQEERRTRVRLRLIREVLAANGIEFPDEVLHGAHDEVLDLCMDIWSTDIDIPERKQVMMFLNCVEKRDWNTLGEPALQRLEEAYVGAVLEEGPTVIEGAPETLAELRGKGMKLGLISNTGRSPGRMIRQVLKKLDLFEYFDAFFFSNEALVRKPSKEAFDPVLRQLGCGASESAHVGDSVKADVAGARAAGMKSVLFAPNGTPVEDGSPNAVVRMLREVPRMIAGF